jgi:hypothetical protein
VTIASTTADSSAADTLPVRPPPKPEPIAPKPERLASKPESQTTRAEPAALKSEAAKNCGEARAGEDRTEACAHSPTAKQ